MQHLLRKNKCLEQQQRKTYILHSWSTICNGGSWRKICMHPNLHCSKHQDPEFSELLRFYSKCLQEYNDTCNFIPAILMAFYTDKRSYVYIYVWILSTISGSSHYWSFLQLLGPSNSVCAIFLAEKKCMLELN